MKEYLELCADIRRNGIPTPDRTGTGTLSVFGRMLRFDLAEGFPLVTTKFTSHRLIFSELEWMLSGSTNVKDLHEMDNHIWDEWARENGDLGPIYGKQWRRWDKTDGTTVDQIHGLITKIKDDKHSRRHVLSAWNVGQIDEMALPPCHLMAQFNVSRKHRYGGGYSRLDCMVVMRSADVFLGLPFDIASYAALTHWMARKTGMEPGDLIFCLGNAHIYENHLGCIDTQLTRYPFAKPSLIIVGDSSLRSNLIFKHTDMRLQFYQHYPAIKGQISV